MLKNISKLELQISNRVYSFLLDNDSPLEHIKEALFQFQKFVGQVEDQMKVAKENALKEEVQKEVPNV